MRDSIYRVLIASFLVATSGCTFAKHRTGAQSDDNGTATVCADQIDYKAVVQAVLQPKCLSCHGSGSGLVSFDSYTSVQNYIGAIQAAIESGRMPPGKPLSQSEKDVVRAWVIAGTPETQSPGTSTCDNANDGAGSGAEDVVIVVPQLEPHYESLKKMIFAPRCIACHDEFSELDFSTYAATIKNKKLFNAKPGEDGDFVEAVASGFMPPGKVKLTREEVNVIRQWVMLGLPERAGSPPLGLKTSAALNDR